MYPSPVQCYFRFFTLFPSRVATKTDRSLQSTFVLQWDPLKPSDRTKWSTQNTLAKNLNPPYVYNVRSDDENGFVNALKEALENPIDQ